VFSVAQLYDSDAELMEDAVEENSTQEKYVSEKSAG